MSKRNKGVELINSRTTAEAKEHRREVLETVHECKMKGFSHGDTVNALRQKFQVTRDMGREYITWYNAEKYKKRTQDFEERRQLLWDRLEYQYGRADELSEATGDLKPLLDITKEQIRMVENDEKRLAHYQPELEVAPRKPLAELSPKERELLRLLYEARKDNANTSATVVLEAPTPEPTAEAATETEVALVLTPTQAPATIPAPAAVDAYDYEAEFNQ